VVVTAVRGGLAVLTQLPVADDDAARAALGRTPVVFPLVGYLVGVIAGLPFLLPVPIPTTAAAYLGTLYLLTGADSIRGLATVGTDPEGATGDDATTAATSPNGAGGTLLVGLSVVALALAAFGVAGTSPARALAGALPLAPAVARALTAVALVVAAEVGAKTGLAVLVCTAATGTNARATAPRDSSNRPITGLAAGEAGLDGLLPVAVAVLPVVAVAPALGQAAVAAAVSTPVATAWLVGRWARPRGPGGVSDHALGAANELGRVVGLHAGVVAWTLL
jgi:adenosylcobinamide-GDP ribazoletransferase